MDNVDADNGCMWFSAGTHLKEIRKHRPVKPGVHVLMCDGSEVWIFYMFLNNFPLFFWGGGVDTWNSPPPKRSFLGIVQGLSWKYHRTKAFSFKSKFFVLYITLKHICAIMLDQAWSRLINIGQPWIILDQTVGRDKSFDCDYYPGSCKLINIDTGKKWSIMIKYYQLCSILIKHNRTDVFSVYSFLKTLGLSTWNTLDHVLFH